MQQIRSLATATITGRLGGSPEPIGKGGSGVQVSIAVKELLPAKNPDDPNEKREDQTHWFRVTLWGEARSKWATENLRKGDIVTCHAQMHTREYRPDGAKKPITVTNLSVPPNWDFVQLHKYEPPPGGDKADGRSSGGQSRGRGAPQADEPPRYEYDDPRPQAQDTGRGSGGRSYTRNSLPPPEPPPERTARGRGR